MSRFSIDCAQAARTDSLKDAIDYAEVAAAGPGGLPEPGFSPDRDGGRTDCRPDSGGFSDPSGSGPRPENLASRWNRASITCRLRLSDPANALIH